MASDVGKRLARRFGILYRPNDASRRDYTDMGFPFDEITDGGWEFPMTTAVVTDHTGLVRFADVAPDWLRRTEPAPILDAVREVVRE